MPFADLLGVTHDCDDPQPLARFYHQLTGMGFSSDGRVALTGSRVPAGRQLPGSSLARPADSPTASPRLRSRGSGRRDRRGAGPERDSTEHQSGGDRYRVLLGPAGHPFCLLAAQPHRVWASQEVGAARRGPARQQGFLDVVAAPTLALSLRSGRAGGGERRPAIPRHANDWRMST
jgi:hypothetical protein